MNVVLTPATSLESTTTSNLKMASAGVENSILAAFEAWTLSPDGFKAAILCFLHEASSLSRTNVRESFCVLRTLFFKAC